MHAEYIYASMLYVFLHIAPVLRISQNDNHKALRVDPLSIRWHPTDANKNRDHEQEPEAY